MIKTTKKTKLIVLTSILFWAVGPLVPNAAGFADAGGGGGGDLNCNGFITTCYGSTWREYTLNPGQSSIYINGLTGTYASVAPGGTINCAPGGTYYRYAFVARQAAYGFAVGDQVGIGRISNPDPYNIYPWHPNGTYWYKSVYFGGGMSYRERGDNPGKENLNWEEAKTAFNSLTTAEKNGYTWDSASTLGWFCGDPPEPPRDEEIYDTCPLPNSTYSLSSGGTQAASGVRNMSASDSTWKQTDSSSLSTSTVTVWAKPGDSVQFKHTLCFGAQKVRGDTNSDTPTVANNATISAATAPSSGSANYLFGKTLTGTNSKTLNLTIGAARPSASSTADVVGDYFFTYYSPSQKTGNAAGDTYKCYANNSAFPTFIGNGYQIPGFTSGSKPSDCKAVSNSDVGKTIEQKLTWDNVSASASRNSSTGKYTVTTKTSNGTPQTAQVKIPFNYRIEPTSSISSNDGVVYAGEAAKVQADIKVAPRDDNPDITGNYATISKPSVYEVVAFTVPPSYGSMPTKLNGSARTAGGIDKTACSYYSVQSGTCESIERKTDVTLNGSGNLNGATDNVFNGKLNVPDLEVGWKYCVAVGVFPSDSHNWPDNNKNGTNNTALNVNNGNGWSYSKASCTTIAKKPSVQIYNSGVITSGGIKSSISEKIVTSASGNKINRTFGSWSEYEAIAKSQISFFGSGAAYGYERNNGGNYTIPGGYQGHNPTVCTYSTQSFNNEDCDSTHKTVGLSNINPSNIALDRLRARYTDSNAKATQQANRNIDLEGTCILGSDNKYHPSRDGYSVSTTTNYVCLSNGAKYVKVIGDATIGGSVSWYCMLPGNSNNSRTAVIDVSGTLTLDTNFAYGELGTSGCAASTYTDIAELPQMLVFAKNINITGRVVNIDAWLIADQNDGVINTCSEVSSYEGLNADTCNQQLKINGPVFASKVLLNRTYGAGSGNASIQPAEIFNLRNDAYYWAYNQAQRFSQSVTVYSREVAPRY